MPTSIDDKVVELRFDNRDFEKNTKQSMATLDKLKTSLDMTESERSFEKLSRSSDDLSFSKASSSVDTFSVKLSALSSVAISAIGRITNSLMDMGEQLVRNMLGVDEIRSGFAKYEENVGYQQTMLLSSDNLSEAEMQKLLDKLEWFSDETSFEMSSMMKAMSSYMAAGADEVTSQAAAIGTALWAAFSGNGGEALASANYALPQVFTRGMTREIWRMISNAKMDIPKIRQLFMETAEEVGTLKKVSEGVWEPITEEAKSLKKVYKVTQENFLEAMTPTAWLNKDVYLKAMSKISKFTDQVYDEYERLEGKELTFDIIERLGEVGDTTEELGFKAMKAAQETKTWSETWEYIKKAITGGWSTTFETVIGDFSKARDFFSKIVESLYSIFITSGVNRNNILSKWAEYMPEAADAAGDLAGNLGEAEKAVANVERAVKSVRDVVINIIRGNYKNGSVRIAALAEEFGAETGAELQGIVNQVWKQWDGKTWSLNYELLDQITDGKTVSSKTADAIKTAAKAIEEEKPLLNGRADLLDGIAKFLSGIGTIKETIDEVLWGDGDKNEGALSRYFNINPEGLYEFTHKISEWMREFGKNSKNFDGTFVDWIVKDLSQLRDILSNLAQPVKSVFGAFGDAFKNTFFPEGTGDPVLNFFRKLSTWLDKVKDFTARFAMDEERIAKIRTIFEGLLTPIKLVGKILGAVSDTIADIVYKSTEGADKRTIIDVLIDAAEWIAKLIKGFDEWLDRSGAIDNFIVPAIEFISNALSDVWDWIKKLLKLDSDKAFPSFDDLFAKWQNIKGWLREHIVQPINDFFGINLHIPTWDEIAKGWGDIRGWITEHLVNPFSEFIGKFTGGKEIKWPTWDGLKEKWKNFRSWFHDNVIAPFEQMTGIDLHFPTLDEVKDFFGKIWDWISKLFGAGKDSAKAADSVKEQGHSWEVIGNIFGAIFNVVKQIIDAIGKIITYLSQNETLNKALNAGLLGGFLALIIKLTDSVAGLASLNPLEFLNRIGEGVKRLMIASANQKNAEALKQVVISVGILVASMILLSLLPVDQMQNALAILVELTGIITGLLAVLSKFSSGSSSQNAGVNVGNVFDTSTWSGSFGSKTTTKTYDSLAIALLEIAGAIAVMAVAIRIVAKLNPSELRTGLFAIEELMFMIVGAMAVLNSTSKTLKSESSKSLFGESHSSEETIGQVTIQFVSIAILISALASAIKKLSTIPHFDTNNAAYTAVVTLLAMVEGLILAVAKITSNSEGNGKKTAKVTAPLMAILFTIVGLVLTIVYVSKTFNEKQLKSFETVAKWILGLTALVGVIAIAIVGFISKAEPRTPKSTEKGKIIKMAAAISIIVGAMSVLILSLTAAMGVMLGMIKEGLTSEQMDLVSEYMRILILAIAIVAAFGVGLSAMAGKLNNSDFRNLIGLSTVVTALSLGISVLVLSLSVFVKSSEQTSWDKMLVALGGVAAIIAAISLMLGVILSKLKTNSFTGSNTLLKLVGISVVVAALSAGISLILLSMTSLASVGDWGVILATSGALTLVVLAIMAFMATLLGMTKNLGGSGPGGLAKLGGITMAIYAITLGLSALVLALSHLTKSGDVSAIVATLGMFSLVIVALTVLLAGLSALETNSGGSVTKVGVAFLGIAAGMALLSLGLSEIIKNTAVSPGGRKALWQAVLALTALMAVVTIAAAIAGIPMVTAGFTALSVFFATIGASALMVASGLTLIVTALTKFKDAIYDIGENAGRFEAGLDAIINGAATALKNALPKFLKTIQSALTGLPTTVVDLIVGLLKTLNERTPEIIAQVAESIIKLLKGLSDYIGPLVSVLFDFVINLLEGLAYAINTNAGRLTAAIMDVLVSIVVLTNNALGALLSSIFHFLGMDVIGDKITDVFGWISKKSVKAFSAAGDDVIRSSESVSKDIINSSPRLAAYYEKTGATISSSIGNAADGISSMLGLSGDKISETTAKAFNFNKMSSLTGGFTSMLGDGNFAFDISGIKSFGESLGISFSAGVSDGIEVFSLSDFMPTAEEARIEGYKLAKAQQDGQTQALVEGLRSGKLSTVNQFKKWVETTGADSDFVNEIMDKIESGEINDKNFNTIQALYNKRIKEQADTTAQDNQVEAFLKVVEGFTDEAGNTVKGLTDGMGHWLHGLDTESSEWRGQATPLSESYDAMAMLEVLAKLQNSVVDRKSIDPKVLTYLLEMREIIGQYAGNEAQLGISMIDYLLGYTDTKVDTTGLVGWIATVGRAKVAADSLNEVTKQSTDSVLESGNDLLAQMDKSAGYTKKYRDSMISYYNGLDDGREIIEGQTESMKEFVNAWFNEMTAAEREANSVVINAQNDDFLEFFNWFGQNYDILAERASGKMVDSVEKLVGLHNQTLKIGTQQQKDTFNELISNLASEVPELTRQYSEIFGIDIPMPKADWSKIIGDPSTITKDQVRFLFSYMFLLGGDVADNYINGLAAGLAKTSPVESSAKAMALTLDKTTRKTLQIKSPSRVGKEIGRNFVLGVANGVEDTTDEAGLASEETAISMWQRLKDAINASVGFNVDELSPVVRPILDLDEIIAGSEEINGLVGGTYQRGVGLGLGIGATGYGDLQAIAQLNRTGLAQAIQESALSQPVNQTLNNTFNIQSNDPNEVARRVSAILSSQIERKSQVWGPARVTRATQ